MGRLSTLLVGLLIPIIQGVATGAVGGPLEAKAADRYSFEIFELPATPVPSQPVTAAINDHGSVTGYVWYYCGGHCRGFVSFLYRDGALTPIGRQSAFAINNRGQVVGSSVSVGWQPSSGGFIYEDGVYKEVNVPGALATTATAINNRGWIAGYFIDSTQKPHGYLYIGNNLTAFDMPAADALYINCLDVNERGATIGYYSTQCSPLYCPKDHSFLRSERTVVDIDVPNAAETIPNSINNKGTVVGTYREHLDGNYRGFIYSRGAFRNLDFPGAQSTHPMAINETGQIAGFYQTSESPEYQSEHAFVYDGVSFTTVDDSWGLPARVYSINACGQVAGFTGISGVKYGFIATPEIAILDRFDQSAGNLAQRWNGSTGDQYYEVLGGSLAVRKGGPIYWRENPFGRSQEAFVSLTNVDPYGLEQGLLLKVQGVAGDYTKGAIAVTYDARQKSVRVATWRKNSSAWRNYRDIPVSFHNADKLRAQVREDGKIMVYRNDKVIRRITLGSADRHFFNKKIGRIGLWFTGAPSAEIDDFGGGTSPLSQLESQKGTRID